MYTVKLYSYKLQKAFLVCAGPFFAVRECVPAVCFKVPESVVVEDTMPNCSTQDKQQIK